jgi:hypothetical protein
LSFTYAQSLGDVNNNGSVDIVDALITAQYYVGLSVSINTTVADVNCNGTIDIVDALLIAQYYVGLLSAFACAPTVTPSPNPTIIPTTVPGEGDVRLVPSSQTVFTGNTFTTPVYANSGDKRLAIFQFTIYYPANNISVDMTVGRSGVSVGSSGFNISGVNVIQSGRIIITGYEPAGIEPGTNLHLLTINWIATNAGTGSIFSSS